MNIENIMLRLPTRIIIAAIALVGVVETFYLTIAEFMGKAGEICPNEGCKLVLESPYAQIFGLPLTLFGFFAYVTVAVLVLTPLLWKNKPKWESQSWLLLAIVASCMAVSSAYLMYIMVFTIKALCPYCIASATFSGTILLLTLFAHRWRNFRQILLTCFLAGLVTLTGVVGVYANVNYSGEGVTIAQAGNSGPPITNESGTAEMALAEHLSAIDAKVYTAFTCPHCHQQKELFGKKAVTELNDIECNPRGENAQPELCRAAGLQGVPSWEINGTIYPGVQPLERLADLSEYTGDRNFIHEFPYR